MSEREKKDNNVMVNDRPENGSSQEADLEEMKTIVREITNQDLQVIVTSRIEKRIKKKNWKMDHVPYKLYPENAIYGI